MRGGAARGFWKGSTRASCSGYLVTIWDDPMYEVYISLGSMECGPRYLKLGSSARSERRYPLAEMKKLKIIVQGSFRIYHVMQSPRQVFLVRRSVPDVSLHRMEEVLHTMINDDSGYSKPGQARSRTETCQTCTMRSVVSWWSLFGISRNASEVERTPSGAETRKLGMATKIVGPAPATMTMNSRRRGS